MARLNKDSLPLDTNLSPAPTIILIAAVILIFTLTAMYAAHRDTRAAYTHLDTAALLIHTKARQPYLQARTTQRYQKNLEEFEMQDLTQPSGVETNEGQKKRPFSTFVQKRRLHDLEAGRPRSAGADIDETKQIGASAVGRFVAIMRGKYPPPADEEAVEQGEAKQGAVQAHTVQLICNKPLPDLPLAPLDRTITEESGFAEECEYEDAAILQRWKAIQDGAIYAPHLTSSPAPISDDESPNAARIVPCPIIPRRWSMSSYTMSPANSISSRRRRQSLPAGVRPLRRMQGVSVAGASVRNGPAPIFAVTGENLQRLERSSKRFSLE